MRHAESWALRVFLSILQPLPIMTIRFSAFQYRAGERIAGDAAKTAEVVFHPPLSSQRCRWWWDVKCSRRKGICCVSRGKPTAVDKFGACRQRIRRHRTISNTYLLFIGDFVYYYYVLVIL